MGSNAIDPSESHGSALLSKVLPPFVYHCRGASLEVNHSQVVLRASLANAILGLWAIPPPFVAKIGRANPPTLIVLPRIVSHWFLSGDCVPAQKVCLHVFE